MTLNAQDASAYAWRGLAWQGAPLKGAVSHKYALSATSAIVVIPRDASGLRPSLMRFSLPAGAVVYAAVGGSVAVVPTTSVDGSSQVFDHDSMTPWGAEQIALVAEASATITITYLWL